MAVNSYGIAYETFLIFAAGSEALISDDVLNITIDRELADFNTPLRAGSASITLYNSDGKYSPRRTDSPYVLRPGMDARIQVAALPDDASGGDAFILNTSQLDCGHILAHQHILFTGTADSFDVQPGIRGSQETRIRLRDAAHYITNRNITTDILTRVNVSSAFTVVLSHGGVPAAQQSVQAISDDRLFVWFQDVQFSTAINELIESGGYVAYLSGDNVFNVKDRNFDVGQPVVASYDQFNSLFFSTTETEIINKLRIKTFPRRISATTETLAEIIEPMQIDPNDSIGFFLNYQDSRNLEPVPGINMITPQPSLDYLTFDNSDGTGTNRVSQTNVAVEFFAESVVSTITNLTGSTIFLTKYQVRGNAIQRFPSVSITRNDTDSQDTFGIHERTLENRLIGRRRNAESLADHLIEKYDDPTDSVRFSLQNVFPDAYHNELADIVNITNDNLGIGSQYYIRGIRHDIDGQSGIHNVDYSVYQPFALGPFLLDSSASGILDTNRLGI